MYSRLNQFKNKNTTFASSYQTKEITINPKFLVVKYIKTNDFFSKIIGYNNIK
jgi:hypothetical protein